jgi:hypothetical protein
VIIAEMTAPAYTIGSLMQLINRKKTLFGARRVALEELIRLQNEITETVQRINDTKLSLKIKSEFKTKKYLRMKLKNKKKKDKLREQANEAMPPSGRVDHMLSQP